MNSRIPLFALCLTLVSPGFASDKSTRKKGGGTLPPTSPMLMTSPDAGNTVDTVDSSGLITTKLSGRDLDFFKSLLETGQLQVLLGELVKTRAESPLVKSVGMILASTQVEENKQVNRLATLNGLALSSTAAGAQRQASAELEKLSGASFDAACVSRIVEANRQTVRAYEEGAESKNPEIQSFSAQMLPIARERLRIAGKLIESPGKPAAGAATPSPHTAPLPVQKPAVATPPPWSRGPVPIPPPANDGATPASDSAKQP